MKTIGLIGGISWQSTQEYYRMINEEVVRRLGQGHSARLLLNSLDFHEIETYAATGDMEGLTRMICDAAITLEKAGAHCILICANTMHMIAHKVSEAVKIPLIHIIDATAYEAEAEGIKRLGLLGTKLTMEMPFYHSYLKKNFGIETLVPCEDDRNFIQQTIFSELFAGITREESRQRFLKIISDLSAAGAGAVILGCTEIPLLVKQEHTSVKLYDTTALHSWAAVDYAMG
jgi:aspartate racemase